MTDGVSHRQYLIYTYTRQHDPSEGILLSGAVIVLLYQNLQVKTNAAKTT